MNKHAPISSDSLKLTNRKDRCLDAVERAARRWRQLTMRWENIIEEGFGRDFESPLNQHIQAAADHLLKMKVDARALEIQPVLIDEAYECGVVSAEKHSGLAAIRYASPRR